MLRQLSCKRLLNARTTSNKLHQHRSYNTSHYILPVFNLSAYCPSDAIETYLHSIHDNIGLPYLFGIFTIPILTKLIIRLPLDVLCGKSAQQTHPLLPDINEDKFESLLTILQKRQDTEPEIWRKYINLSMKQFQIKSINFFPSFITFYIHLSSYIAIERMIFHENAGDTLLFLTNNYLSSTDPYFVLPVINGFGMMFCYAFINQHKAAHFERRRRNVKLCVLFMPFSVLFFSSALQFYILSNLISIGLYHKYTMQNDKFLASFGLLGNEEKYHLSNMEKLSNLYISFNKSMFKSDSFGVFTKSFQGERPTVLAQDIEAVLEDDNLFIPAIPPRDFFRNIEDEIEYFDDEYDEFMERINHKHNVRYLERHKQALYIQESDTLLLDDDNDDITPLIDMKKTTKLTE